MSTWPVLLSCALALSGPVGAAAGAAEPARLLLKDHKFSPATLTVPAGQRIRIEITNADGQPAEFESTALHAEKIIVPGATVSVMAGPLRPGTVEFFDDYHPDSARGTLVAQGN